MSELNRRIIIDGDIYYPITKAENVIHLQKEIKDKLPIVSNEEPEEYVERQVWLDTSEDNEEEQVQTLSFARSFTQPQEELLSFGVPNDNEELTFGVVEEELSFGSEQEELTFGEPNDNEILTFGN